MPARLAVPRGLLARTGLAAVACAVFLALRSTVSEPLTVAGALATVIAVGPLGWGRRHPLAGLAVAAIGAAAVAALDEPDTGVPLIGFVLAFQAAARPLPPAGHEDGRSGRVAAFAALAVVGQAAATALHAPPREVLAVLVAGSVCFALAALAGDNVRRRRQHLVDLQERVLSASRERAWEIRDALSTSACASPASSTTSSRTA